VPPLAVRLALEALEALLAAERAARAERRGRQQRRAVAHLCRAALELAQQLALALLLQPARDEGVEALALLGAHASRRSERRPSRGHLFALARSGLIVDERRIRVQRRLGVRPLALVRAPADGRAARGGVVALALRRHASKI
jgi:hypothetical protein